MLLASPSLWSLLFLMQRERPGLTRRAGLQILSGAAIACVASFAWVQLTDGTEVARFLGVVLGIFVAAFCMVATTMPLLFTIFGFYWFLDLSLWDAHRSPDAIVTSVLYNLASLAIVTLSIIAVEYLFGTRHPADELVREIRSRFTVLSRFFHVMAQEQLSSPVPEFRRLHHALVQYAHAGDFRMNELYDRLRDSSSDLSLVPLGIHYRIGLLTRVIEKSALIGFERHRTAVGHSYYVAIAAQCDQLQANAIGPSDALPIDAPAELIDIHRELQAYAASRQSPEHAPLESESPTRTTHSSRLFVSDAFPELVICHVRAQTHSRRNPLLCALQRFCVARHCHLCRHRPLYRPEFHGSDEAKTTLSLFRRGYRGGHRIATVSLLFPNMDSITSLVLVVAIVSALSGWGAS